MANAENEEILLTSARNMTASELEKLCRMVRHVDSADAAAAEPERRFSQRAIEGGMVRMTVTVPADEAAVITSVLDSFAPAPNRRAEGLVAMVDECSRGSSQGRNPIEVMLQINADDLSGTTSDGAIVPAETSRRLLCDCGVVPVLTGARGKTIDIGRKARTLPTAIRRAMARRDKGCAFPGCSHQIVDGHHVSHWIDGGETKLGNLVSLCRRHHRFVHEGGASVQVGGFRSNAGTNAQFQFLDRNGELLHSAPSPPPATELRTDDADPWLAASRGDGLVPIDWSLLVESCAPR